ncbi:hypothetical protein K3495_g5602 [Podosphaera aphanis]|nr:hypothetical protein K3495_g5602 [Podosphaera aphanis]
MSLIDRNFLRRQAPTITVHKMRKQMKIKGVGGELHDASEFVMLDFYLKLTDNVMAHFQREIHIVNGLAANALLGIDIAEPEGWLIDLDAQLLTLPKCHGLKIPLSTKSHAPRSELSVFANEATIVKPHSRAFVNVATSNGEQLKLGDHDMIFEPKQLEVLTTFLALVSKQFSSILVQNTSNNAVTIGKHINLGQVIEADEDAMCNVMEEEVYFLLAQPPKHKVWSRLMYKGLLAAAVVAGRDSSSEAPQQIESVCQNGVTIFGDSFQSAKLRALVNDFEYLWKDRKTFAKTPNGEEMSIDLVIDWQTKYKAGHAHVYTAGTEDRKLIDKTFDDLHAQGRLQ